MHSIFWAQAVQTGPHWLSFRLNMDGWTVITRAPSLAQLMVGSWPTVVVCSRKRCFFSHPDYLWTLQRIIKYEQSDFLWEALRGDFSDAFKSDSDKTGSSKLFISGGSVHIVVHRPSRLQGGCKRPACTSFWKFFFRVLCKLSKVQPRCLVLTNIVLLTVE